MSRFRLTWFKIRALTFANLQKVFGFILRIPVPPKFSVGAFIEHDGKFLVLDLTYRDGFAFPGGMVEPGESLEQALQREVLEETGLTITAMEYVTSVPDVQYGLGVIAVVFTATVSGTERASAEGALSWETPEQIIKRGSYRNWIKALQDYTTRT